LLKVAIKRGQSQTRLNSAEREQVQGRNALNVAKWHCGKVAIKREQSQARLCSAERVPLRRCQSGAF
ncbi:MAG: hypothetical protein IIT64_11245, partial [Bacteroidaceae bacterium]|nr:hypothetical protein [Bacteroidaceae bacterium]